MGARRRGAGGGKAKQVGQEAPAPALTPHTPIPHPPPLTFSHVRLRRTQTKGLAARCATAVVKERYLILTGAAGQPFATVGPHSRGKKCVFLLACVWLLARGQISKSSMWSKRGKPPRVCLPYDSMSAREAFGAVAGVARASGSGQCRRHVLVGSASYLVAHVPLLCHSTQL